MLSSILANLFPVTSANPHPEVCVIGGGVLGMHVSALLLHSGFPVKIVTSSTQQIAGLGAMGIVERQGEIVTVRLADGTVSKFPSMEWENTGFDFFKLAIQHDAEWVELKPVEYHRENPTSDPFDHPYSGMEAEEIKAEELIPPYRCGVRFKAFLVNTGGYYGVLRNYVSEHPLFRGFDFRDVNHPDEIQAPIKVVACGLGAEKWDDKNFPGLGKTLKLKKRGLDRSKSVGGIRSKFSANIVPIPGEPDMFRVGASKEDHIRPGDVNAEEMFLAILSEAERIRPELIGSIIVERTENMRPKHMDGTQLVEEIEGGQLSVYLMGFGGCGWTFGWAAALATLLRILRFIGA